MLAYYMIPAILYCLYNNLSFTNLAIFDPTTYFMFMQIRLIMTGVIYQVSPLQIACNYWNAQMRLLISLSLCSDAD